MGMNGEWTLMNKCRWIYGIEQTDDDERQMERGRTKPNRWTMMDIKGNGDECQLNRIAVGRNSNKCWMEVR
jgi:hypothetical protein